MVVVGDALLAFPVQEECNPKSEYWGIRKGSHIAS